MVTFSVPALSQMLTVPSYMLSARYRPSLVHDWQMTRLPTLCFTTLFFARPPSRRQTRPKDTSEAADLLRLPRRARRLRRLHG